MASTDRFYLLSFPDGRPLLKGDFGQLVTLSGVLFQGMGKDILMMLPGQDGPQNLEVISPTPEEWSEVIRQSEDPVFLQLDKDNERKIIIRKARYGISGMVQQQIWMRDGCKCMYCGRKMGEVNLSIDHFMPLELGGANDQSNYLSSCRNCNKKKGDMHPADWCRLRGLNYNGLVNYLGHQ